MSKTCDGRAIYWIAGLVAVLLLFAKPSAVLGGAGTWTTAGPEGGALSSLTIDPTDRATLYVGLCGGRVIKSVDRGATWAPAGDFGEGCALKILVDPREPTILYASGFGTGVWKSTDAGATWSGASTGLPSNIVRGLAMDPSAPRTLYVATPGGVYKTTDGGETWLPSSSGLNTAFAVIAVAVDPVSTNIVYASNFDGLYKSTDGGASWQIAGPTSKFIRLIAVNPRTPTTLYVGTGDAGLQRSTDGGATWGKIGPDGLSAIRSFAMDPGNPSVLYAATDHGSLSRLYKSTDAGDTWTPIGRGLSGEVIVEELEVDPSDARTVFAATFGTGVFVSSDAGESFTASNDGLIATSVTAIAVDASPSVPTLYAGTFLSGGLFRSIDGGKSWIDSNNGITHKDGIFSVAVDPFTPGTVYAGTSRDLVKSTDGGASWQTAFATGGPSVRGIVFDPLRPGTMFMTTGTGVQKSVDGGLTWTRSNVPGAAELSSVALDPLATDTVYATTQSLGIFKSIDGGLTWGAASNGLTSLFVPHMAVNPRTPEVLYAATGSGVFKSVDAGALWTKLEGGLPAERASAVAIDPIAPANVYAGTPAGVFKSTDSGATWSALNDGLTDPVVNTIVLNPTRPNIIYAGTATGGVFSLEQPEPGTTEPGSDVVVQPIDTNPNPPTDNPTPVTVTFDQVTSAGTTTVTTTSTGAPPPTGLKLGNPPVYYEISTTASATGPITICINYTGIQFGNESNLRLHHHVNGAWVDVTTSLDTTNDIICGVVASLSPFALFEPEPYAFTGFFAPVNNAPALNSVKAGSALPVKFSLSGDKGLNILKPGYPVTRSIACSGEEPSEMSEQTDTSGQSGLRYDASSDQYIYAWKTDPAWKGTCRQFELGLNDESTHVIFVQFPNK